MNYCHPYVPKLVLKNLLGTIITFFYSDPLLDFTLGGECVDISISKQRRNLYLEDEEMKICIIICIINLYNQHPNILKQGEKLALGKTIAISWYK